MSISQITKDLFAIASQYKDPAQAKSAQERIRGLSRKHRQLLLKVLNNPEKYAQNPKINSLKQELDRVMNYTYTFQDPGNFKNAWHAVQHAFGARIYSSEVLNKINNFPAKQAHFAKDATYETDGSGIVDFSYANLTSGFGYVADGTGHNNPLMAPVIGRIFNDFNAKYQKALKKEKPVKDTEWKAFIKQQLTQLGQTIHKEPQPVLNDPKKPSMTHLSDNTLKPAFSFAQIANCGGQRKLFYAQFSDTILLIRKSNGEFDISLAQKKPEDYGLGDNSTPKRRNIQVGSIDLNEEDEVFGFSDGIGEFLEIEQLEQVINNNQDRTQLLTEIKERIIEEGNKGIVDEHGRKEMKGVSANGMGVIKFHDPNNSKNYDDISLFMLQAN